MLIQKLEMCINFHLLLKQLLTNYYYRGIIRYLELFLSKGLCCNQGISWARQGSNSFASLRSDSGQSIPQCSWAGKLCCTGREMSLQSLTLAQMDSLMEKCLCANLLLILFWFNVPVNCLKFLYVTLVSTILYLDALRQITERLQLPSM